MRILLVGKHELACRLWAELRTAPGVELGAVTSRSEDGGGGGRASLKADLAAAGTQPLNVDFTHAELLRVVHSWRPDLLLSAGYDKIIRAEVLDVVPECLNVHFGMLPKYRGSYSIPWAILNREDRIGVTLHRISPGIDDGPIVLQEGVVNDPARSCRDLYLEAVERGVQLVSRFLSESRGGETRTVPQDERAATYHSPEFPHGYRIPWRQTATYVYDYIRACHFPPFAPAFTEIGERRVGIEFPVRVEYGRPVSAPGEIEVRDAEPWIATLNGWIRPARVLVDEEARSFDDLVSESRLQEAH